MEAYSCRKCRRVLFVSTALEPKAHPDKKGEALRKPCTSYWLSTPPAWMHQEMTKPAEGAGIEAPVRRRKKRDDEDGGVDEDGDAAGDDHEDDGASEGEDAGETAAGANEGKLMCPGCGTRFGTFCWSGTTCSCGSWVVPAIQVPMSRVDKRAVPPESLTRLGMANQTSR